jgi:hypothetical protein
MVKRGFSILNSLMYNKSRPSIADRVYAYRIRKENIWIGVTFLVTAITAEQLLGTVFREKVIMKSKFQHFIHKLPPLRPI